jgi:hypothetical protein
MQAVVESAEHAHQRRRLDHGQLQMLRRVERFAGANFKAGGRERECESV